MLFQVFSCFSQIAKSPQHFTLQKYNTFSEKNKDFDERINIFDERIKTFDERKNDSRIQRFKNLKIAFGESFGWGVKNVPLI